MNRQINQIIHGKCQDIMKTLSDNYIDLTVTSPPYDQIRKYNGYDFNFEGIAQELFRITKEGGVVVWVVKDQTKKYNQSGTCFKQALYFQNVGFNFYDTLIYQKLVSSPPHDNYYNDNWEYIFVFSKGIPKLNPIKDHRNKHIGIKKAMIKNADNSKRNKLKSIGPYSKRGKVWSYAVGGNKSTKDKMAFEHPAIMPEKLATDCIKSWSNEHDLIFDPFAGSGTTLKMAKLNNRNYLGIEISEKYIKIIEKRLDKYDIQKLEGFI